MARAFGEASGHSDGGRKLSSCPNFAWQHQLRPWPLFWLWVSEIPLWGTVDNNVLVTGLESLLLMSLALTVWLNWLRKKEERKTMHAKKLDKLLNSCPSIPDCGESSLTILASLILYILVRGLPHISWSFLTGKSSSYQAGGGIGIQLYNLPFPISYYLDYLWCL